MGEQAAQSSVNKLWSELIRRRVIRVVVVYSIAGWIVIEVASTVLPNLNPHDTRALYVGANQLCSVGELDKGLELAERALGQDEKEPVVLYNVACFYAMKGDPDRSNELLERAVENGWGDRAWLETDSDLDSLRDNVRFRAILADID